MKRTVIAVLAYTAPRGKASSTLPYASGACWFADSMRLSLSHKSTCTSTTPLFPSTHLSLKSLSRYLHSSCIMRPSNISCHEVRSCGQEVLQPFRWCWWLVGLSGQIQQPGRWDAYIVCLPIRSSESPVEAMRMTSNVYGSMRHAVRDYEALRRKYTLTPDRANRMWNCFCWNGTGSAGRGPTRNLERGLLAHRRDRSAAIEHAHHEV